MAFKKKGKTKAALLATVIFASLLSACRGKPQIAEGADVFERMRNTTYEVKFLFPGLDPQLDMALVIKAFNDKLTELGYPGLTIKLEGYDWGSWQDRSSAFVLSGGAYDLVWAPDWSTFYNDAMLGGAWLPWDDYIDLIPEYAQWQAPWREYLYVWGADPKEKHIYRVPGVKEHAGYYCEARWNKRVADKLGITEGMRNLKTLRDLEPYLDMYRDAYGNSGMAVLAVDTDTVFHYFLLGADGNPFRPVYDPATDRYLNGAFNPAFDEYIQLRRDWYAKGYIPDYQQVEVWDDLVVKFGPESFLVYFNQGKPGGEAESNLYSMQRHGFEWGTTWLLPAFIDFNNLMGSPWALNARSGNPEAAAFVYELLSTEKDLTNLINYGIEGLHYTLNEEGVLIASVPSRYFLNVGWMLGNRFLCHRLPGEPENLAELYWEFNENAVKLPNFAFPYPGDEAWTGVDRDMFQGVYGALWARYQRSIQIGTISDDDIADIRGKLTQANYQGMDAVMNREYEKFKASQK